MNIQELLSKAKEEERNRMLILKAERLDKNQNAKQYINKLWRSFESKPEKIDNKVPEIYVIDPYLKIFLTWFTENDNKVFDRQENKWKDITPDMKWCYKEELFC